ncbi:NAD(P)H-hydrate dehydratase [Pseudodesulfovibrio pelocollis]|uniref:NAD(P)H-hydrate dehydratase n=1 Tax=Pseudodesulfovibrio pelocollis TaxID=3051432 RepID=UPI00255AB25E|nr:NAD(P)H-hydrate dehydratase [Pseudodesulfovibrio sp. SB368]
MLAIVGTVPDPDLPIVEGEALLEGAALMVAGRRIPTDRGTPALLAAACAASATLGLPAPHAFLVGDQGLGHGSRALYAHLTDTLPGRDIATLVFHYLMPDVMWHDKVLFAVETMAARPRLIADAGFMYAAKMSGQASAYDLFTPDAGELAFLADETAPHPFYTRGFILHDDNNVPDLIRRAYGGGNAARCLLVKGSVDHVADAGGVLHTVDSPCEEALEAMGGTGDTVAGIAAALVEGGLSVAKAAHLAARANRLAGQLACPNPGSRIAEIVVHIPQALKQAMNGTGQ